MSIALPSIDTDAGIIVRVLIAETRNPAYASYDEEAAKRSFRAMRATVDHRLHNNPGLFGAPGAKTYADVICAPQQFAGFTKNASGTPTLSDDVQELIDEVLEKASTGAPGRYAKFVQNALDAAKGAVDDPFAKVTDVGGTAVTGGVYGWRTLGSSAPGGRLIAIPAPEGVILHNQFFALTA